MQHRSVVFVNFDASLEQLSIQMIARVSADAHVVVFAGQHNFYVDTAPPGFDQDLNPRVVRNEVRVRYVNRPAGRYDREVVHDPDSRRPALGRTQESLRGYASSLVERRKIIGAADQLSCGLKPVLRKARLKT